MSRRLEFHAVELLRRGLDPGRVADLTTLPMRRVRELATGRPDCGHGWCGQPRQGHPLKGSIRVHQAGAASTKTALWFCSWRCVVAHASLQEAAA